jgi:hypothetical protein
VNLTRLLFIRISLSGFIGGMFAGISSYFYTNYKYDGVRDDLIKDKISNEEYEETLDDVRRRKLIFDNDLVDEYMDYKYELGLLEICFEKNESLTIQKLKEAKINLLKKWHPDIYKGDKQTANLMTIKINEAYYTLLKLL